MVGNFTGQVELQKAKDELDNCTFVSPSTKGCYSSRIALWIHYCNQCCNGDDAVTGSRLGDYVEWMVDSGAAERIRQDQTHIQQVLRNQLQGVICYWRIQNNDRADVPDPRKSHVFMSKWHGIVQRFPRERQSRRSEPIYGTQLPGTDSNPVAMPRSRPSPPPPTSLMNKWRPAISGPSGGAGSRPLPPISHHQHSLQRHRYPSTFNGATVNGTNPPAAFHSSAASDGGQAQASNEHMYRSPQVATRAPIAPQARMGGPNSHPLASSKFIIPQVPSLQLASHAASANNAAMSRVSSASLEYEDEAKAENDERASSYQRAPGRPSVHVPQQVPKHEAPLSTLNKSLRGEFPSEMPVWDASAVKAPEGYLLVKEEVAALNLRQLEINNYQQAQARAYYNLGIASWLSVEQRSALTLADVFMDETSTLAIQEQQLLLPLVQVASSPPAMQREGLVPHAADGSEEKPIPSTAPASPARDTTDMIVRKAESLPPVNSAPLVQGSLEREAPPAAEQSTGGLVLAATVSPARAISIAIRSPSGMHSGMTQVLRHSNPLLCTWSALAIMFFQKWHLAKEPTPDFASPQWLSGKLFTSANGANAAMVAEDFEMAFKVACKDISSDSLSGFEAMSDSGYFYADAFKLTRPSACGIKGLSCVNAIDTDTLLPEISIALIKANAGYSPTIKEPVKAPARFGVIPSQALQREIFPWIRPLMCAILQQGNNNSEVLVATRFMRMLKKLRMVLLQDIAFLMEVPLLTGSFQTHRTFENKIFTSEGFLAYRAEMRNALSNTEIREMESYCISTQRWVKGRKQALPRGDQQRLKPTIERLLQPDFVPPPFSNNIVAANMVLPSPTLPNGAPSLGPAPSSTGYPEGNMGLKRTHGEPHSQSPGALHSIEYRADSSAPMLITKRARHGPELAKVAMQMHPDEGAVDMSEAEAKEVVVTEEQPLARVMATIDELRMENDDLRYQMRRIESTLAQQRNEVRSWMGKVEMAIQGRLQASARPRSVSPDNESAGQYYPGAAARAGQPHLTPVHSRQPAYQSQASSQQQMYHARQQVRPPPQLPSQQAQRAYADGRYQQQAVGPAVAHRQASDMVAMHEGGMYGGNGIGSAEAHAAAARRHFTLNRHKSGMQQQAQMAHMGGHPGAAAQMQHVSYSRHGQAQAPSDYSPRRAYADPHVSPQTHYPPAHVNGPERADVSWHNGSQHPSAYSSRRASPGPRDGF